MGILDNTREKLFTFYDEVSRKEVPHIFDALDELHAHPSAGDKAKFDKVYILKAENKGLQPMLDYLAGCMVHKDKNVLVLGRDIMEDLGVEAEVNKPVTREFKAVLAHEMGHAFHGDLRKGGTKILANLSPLVGLVGGVAGAYIAKKIIEQHPHDREKQKEAFDEHKESLKAADNGTLGAAAKVGLYAAGSALGLGAGLLGTRMLHRKMEFRADAYAKELMGEGESLSSAFETLSNSFAEMNNLNISEGATKNEVVKSFDNSRTMLQRILHPAMGERIEALGR